MDLSFIRNVRKDKGFSIQELSILTNIPEKRLLKIEKNELVPNIDEVTILANVLGYKIVAQDKINIYSGKEYNLVK